MNRTQVGNASKPGLGLLYAFPTSHHTAACSIMQAGGHSVFTFKPIQFQVQPIPKESKDSICHLYPRILSRKLQKIVENGRKVAPLLHPAAHLLEFERFADLVKNGSDSFGRPPQLQAIPSACPSGEASGGWMLLEAVARSAMWRRHDKCI